MEKDSFCENKWSLIKQSVKVADGEDTWIEFLEARNLNKPQKERENYIDCISHDSLIITYNGIKGKYKYSIDQFELSIGNDLFEMIELSDTLLIIKNKRSKTTMVYSNQLYNK